MRRNDGAAHGDRVGAASVAAAFDELRFGRANMLDLRSNLPTGADAALRAERFLRERQMANARDVLIITGRGNRSIDGIAVVRPAVAKVLARLRRTGVVMGWQEHTPGSFAVTPAPIGALFEAPRRHGDDRVAPHADHDGLLGLDSPTRMALRRLAIRSLQQLGVPAGESFVQDEMQRQYAILCQSVFAGTDREAQFRAAAERALDEMDDAK